jgi:hypothetical protein
VTTISDLKTFGRGERGDKREGNASEAHDAIAALTAASRAMFDPMAAG